jgi:hypothetical protein
MELICGTDCDILRSDSARPTCLRQTLPALRTKYNYSNGVSH